MGVGGIRRAVLFGFLPLGHTLVAGHGQSTPQSNLRSRQVKKGGELGSRKLAARSRCLRPQFMAIGIAIRRMRQPQLPWLLMHCQRMPAKLARPCMRGIQGSSAQTCSPPSPARSPGDVGCVGAEGDVEGLVAPKGARHLAGGRRGHGQAAHALRVRLAEQRVEAVGARALRVKLYREIKSA